MHFLLFRSIVALNPAFPSVNLRVPPNNRRNFSLFGVCPSNKHGPSARCAYAANAVGKNLDIFAARAISLNQIYTHQPKIVNIIYSQS
jgi:hypothetical protein